jgi:hypothetical protein
VLGQIIGSECFHKYQKEIGYYLDDLGCFYQHQGQPQTAIDEIMFPG